ncbi:MAG: ATP-binding cassette domain-containing protein, partial [Pseudomonadota bacterium]
MANAVQQTDHSVSSSPKAANADTYFSVQDVHGYYGESYIVQGVSFDVREGEILALLGRNGAGKTSTLRTIARTDDPQVKKGEIWLDGL